MSEKTFGKIGFFAALTMLIGSVVGIGIFFKNGSILKAGDFNGSTALCAWIVGGLLALCAALSFSEIGSMKIKKTSGLSVWSRAVGGKKYGFFVQTNFTIFYWGFLAPILGYFVTELLFLMFNTFDSTIKMPPVWVMGLISIAITVFSMTLNYFSVRVSGWVQQLTTVIKFMPLLIAMLIGLIFFDSHNSSKGENYFTNGSFTFEGLLAGLPAVLFSYDAFMAAPQLTNKVKGGAKTISKVVLVGIISIIVLYSLIAVAAIFHAGSISDIISDSLNATIANDLNIFVHITLFFAGYGVMNGVSAASVSSVEEVVESDLIFGVKILKKRFSNRKITTLLLNIFSGAGFLLCVLPGMILGTDAYIDATSNFPTLFFFAIYATTVLMYLRKRDSFETKKMHNKLFLISAWLFIIGTYFIVLYQLIYGFSIRGFINGWNHKNVQGVGLFAESKYIITNLNFFLIFMGFLILFLAIPATNQYLIKKYEKRQLV